MAKQRALGYKFCTSGHSIGVARITLGPQRIKVTAVQLSSNGCKSALANYIIGDRGR